MLTTETNAFDPLFIPGRFQRSSLMRDLGIPEAFAKTLCGIRFCLLKGIAPLETLPLGCVDGERFLEVRLDPEPVLLVHRWERPTDPYDAADAVLRLAPTDTLRQLLLGSLVAGGDPELLAYLAAAGYRQKERPPGESA